MLPVARPSRSLSLGRAAITLARVLLLRDGSTAKVSISSINEPFGSSSGGTHNMNDISATRASRMYWSAASLPAALSGAASAMAAPCSVQRTDTAVPSSES